MLSTSKLVGMVVALAAFASGQAPSKINDFNASPTKLGMYAYVPKNLKSPAPIVVAIHHCQGSALGYAQETKYQPLADQHGFIVIYPNSKSSGGCFDVSSPETLKHDGGGDSQTIANMVHYAVSKWNGDLNNTFVTGSSSGAMMTNVMAATYPDIFKAASAYSGVPAGCFSVPSSTATSDPPGWNSQCAQGQLTKTAAQWGDIVRAMYPGYSGRRTRMQIWHGTVDTTLRYANYQEALKEWSNVLGLSTSTQKQNTPQSSYTQTIYGSGSQATAELVGYSAAGVGHTVPVHESMDIAFFGIA